MRFSTLKKGKGFSLLSLREDCSTESYLRSPRRYGIPLVEPNTTEDHLVSSCLATSFSDEDRREKQSREVHEVLAFLQVAFEVNNLTFRSNGEKRENFPLQEVGLSEPRVKAEVLNDRHKHSVAENDFKHFRQRKVIHSFFEVAV